MVSIGQNKQFEDVNLGSETTCNGQLHYYFLTLNKLKD